MARKPKFGLDYFPLDVGFFDDDKLEFVSARFGFKGEIITLRLLCKIYSDKGYYYQWGNDEALLFAKRAGFEVTLVNDVVHELIKRTFFSKEKFDSFQILTSKGIQERYFEVAKRRTDNGVIEEYLINVNNNAINVNINALNVDKSTQSKVKESKVNESKQNEKKGNETPGYTDISANNENNFHDVLQVESNKPEYVLQNFDCDSKEVRQTERNQTLEVKSFQKEKNSAQKEKVILPWDSPEFSNHWSLYKQFRKEQHKFVFNSPITEQAAVKKLAELSNGIESVAIKIIDQTFTKGWKGLFPLDKNGEQTKSTINDKVKSSFNLVSEYYNSGQRQGGN